MSRIRVRAADVASVIHEYLKSHGLIEVSGQRVCGGGGGYHARGRGGRGRAGITRAAADDGNAGARGWRPARRLQF